MLTYIWIFLFVYVFVLIIKTALLMQAVRPALAGWLRGRWRMTGDRGSAAGLVFAAVMLVGILVTYAFFWPLILLKERGKFFRPYNARSVARQALRGVQEARKR